MSIAHEKLLETIPDLTSWQAASNWVQQKQRQAAQFDPQAKILAVEWKEIEQKPNFPFGLYSSEKWRKFVLATFLADLISYVKPIDQVSFERLLYVMHAFPHGFRTWWVELSNQDWLPVGYTGWYPMLETAYELFEKNPEKLKDRMVVPNTSVQDKNSYIYLFNFSVGPAYRKSQLSKLIMKKYVQDISEQKPSGLACITVSEDGIRIANRFGMSCCGHLNLDGTLEGVYVS